MLTLNKKELLKSTIYFERKFGKIYDLKIHNEKNILPGKGIYVANHFHHFDPIFILYSVAKTKSVLAHQLAKSSLFKLPIIGKALKKFSTIVTPRPNRGEKMSFNDYEKFKDDIYGTLENDDAISYAYAGGMTKNYTIDSDNLAKEIKVANSGLLTVARKVKGLKIVPIAVETYQRRSKMIFLKAFLYLTPLSRFFTPKKKYGVDLMFGKAIDIDTFIKNAKVDKDHRNKRQLLIEHVVGKVFELREKIAKINKDDPNRSTKLYFK